MDAQLAYLEGCEMLTFAEPATHVEDRVLEADRLLGYGQEAETGGNIVIAREFYEDALTHAPRHRPALLAAGRCLERLGDERLAAGDRANAVDYFQEARRHLGLLAELDASNEVQDAVAQVAGKLGSLSGSAGMRDVSPVLRAAGFCKMLRTSRAVYYTDCYGGVHMVPR